MRELQDLIEKAQTLGLSYEEKARFLLLTEGRHKKTSIPESDIIQRQRLLRAYLDLLPAQFVVEDCGAPYENVEMIVKIKSMLENWRNNAKT